MNILIMTTYLNVCFNLIKFFQYPRVHLGQNVILQFIKFQELCRNSGKVTIQLIQMPLFIFHQSSKKETVFITVSLAIRGNYFQYRLFQTLSFTENDSVPGIFSTDTAERCKHHYRKTTKLKHFWSVRQQIIFSSPMQIGIHLINTAISNIYSISLPAYKFKILYTLTI